MNKKTITTLILIAAILIITISFYPKYEINKIESEINKANYCTTAQDCVLVSSKCPFGCYVYVNKAEAERITDLIDSYETNCVYGCISCETVTCQNNQCEPVCDSPSESYEPICDTTKRQSPTGEIYYSITDECYYETHSPIDLLEDLKTHPEKPLDILMAPDSWIKKEHIEILMTKIDSSEPASPVVSLLSSYYPGNETSTVGNEAIFMIMSYKDNKTYPPALHSLVKTKPNESEILAWWDTVD